MKLVQSSDPPISGKTGFRPPAHFLAYATAAAWSKAGILWDLRVQTATQDHLHAHTTSRNLAPNRLINRTRRRGSHQFNLGLSGRQTTINSFGERIFISAIGKS